VEERAKYVTNEGAPDLGQLEKVAAMFEAAAKEIRSARLHDGRITDEQERALMHQARANAQRIAAEARSITGERFSRKWLAVMEALEALYERWIDSRAVWNLDTGYADIEASTAEAVANLVEAYTKWLD